MSAQSPRPLSAGERLPTIGLLQQVTDREPRNLIDVEGVRIRGKTRRVGILPRIGRFVGDLRVRVLPLDLAEILFACVLQVAHLQRLHEAVDVDLVGHTDTTGVEATNLPLSQQRADQIRGSLLRNGVKAVNLRPHGVGTTQPLRSEDTEDGRQLNRSVTFKVYFSAASAGAAY